MNLNGSEMKYSLLTLILLFAVSALLYALSLVFHAMGHPYGFLAWLALLATGCFVAVRRWWCMDLREQAGRDYKKLRELSQKYEHLDEAYKSICDTNERLRKENERLSQKQEHFDKAYQHLWDENERLSEENEHLRLSPHQRGALRDVSTGNRGAWSSLG